jgi:hypothetical protein
VLPSLEMHDRVLIPRRVVEVARADPATGVLVWKSRRRPRTSPVPNDLSGMIEPWRASDENITDVVKSRAWLDALHTARTNNAIKLISGCPDAQVVEAKQIFSQYRHRKKSQNGGEFMTVFSKLRNGVILWLYRQEERSEDLKNRQVFYDYKAADMRRFWWLCEFNCDVAANLIFRPLTHALNVL